MWLARDARRDIDVAVKLLKRHVVASDAIVERFIREAIADRKLLREAIGNADPDLMD